MSLDSVNPLHSVPVVSNSQMRRERREGTLAKRNQSRFPKGKKGLPELEEKVEITSVSGSGPALPMYGGQVVRVTPGHPLPPVAVPEEQEMDKVRVRQAIRVYLRVQEPSDKSAEV